MHALCAHYACAADIQGTMLCNHRLAAADLANQRNTAGRLGTHTLDSMEGCSMTTDSTPNNDQIIVVAVS